MSRNGWKRMNDADIYIYILNHYIYTLSASNKCNNFTLAHTHTH